jgi:DNA repair exonuclease SbcCD nuclease subunit
MGFEYADLDIGYPYGIISDVHCHNWSAYSYPTSRGINNRLQQTLDAIELAATDVLKRGGKDLIITGDLFHTRGVLKPSIINPTIALFKDLISRGLEVHCIDGNHDDEFKETNWLGSSTYALSLLKGFNVFHVPTIVDERFVFIPWIENPQEVLNLATKSTTYFRNLTLFCHVGMSGVLPGNFGDTLNPADFDKLDLKYVFSGHFHNHVSFNSRVYSVGALTHQTWGDVGTLAGYIVVTETGVEHYETNAPKFINFEDLATKRVGHHYYTLNNMELTEEEARTAITGLKAKGALGVQDQSTRPNLVNKDHSEVVKVDLGIHTALETFCKHTYGEKWKEVFDACLRLKS